MLQLSYKNAAIIATGCFTAGAILGCGIVMKLKTKAVFGQLFSIGSDHVWPFSTLLPTTDVQIKVITTKSQFDKILCLLKRDLKQVCKLIMMVTFVDFCFIQFHMW